MTSPETNANVSERIHATCVEIDGKGVLLRGASGAGKSDLALRLIERGAKLVADDQVLLSAQDGHLVARAPERLADRLEVRGVGIVRVAGIAQSTVHALFELVSADAVPRLPEREQAAPIASIPLPLWRLDPFELSAPLKVALLVDALALARRENAGGQFRVK